MQPAARTGANRPARALLALGIAALLAGLSTPSPAAPRCSLVTTLGAIGAGSYLVLARPLPDSAPAPLIDADWAWLSARFKQRPSAAWAQRFVVIRADLPDSNAGTLAPGDTFHVVPWGYEADCDWIPWPGSVVWTTDSPVVFRLGAPRIGTTTSAPLVFDELGWHAPYPSGRFLRSRLQGVTGREDWLPATAYFDFVASLPRLGPDEQSFRPPPRVQAAIDRWIAEHPAFADRHPVRLLRSGVR